jgi:hypothetical protein
MIWSSILHQDLLPHLNEILLTAPSDFTVNLEGTFSKKDLESIINRAHSQLFQELKNHSVNSDSELASVWNKIVTDFYTNKYWGYSLQTTPNIVAPSDTSTSQLTSYLRVFLIPTLFLKGALLYFGLNYSSYPEEGYGWGLFIAICLSLFNFLLFLWKTRNSPVE